MANKKLFQTLMLSPAKFAQITAMFSKKADFIGFFDESHTTHCAEIYTNAAYVDLNTVTVKI